MRVCTGEGHDVVNISGGHSDSCAVYRMKGSKCRFSKVTVTILEVTMVVGTWIVAVNNWVDSEYLRGS